MDISGILPRALRSIIALAGGVIIGTILGAFVALGPSSPESLAMWAYQAVICSFNTCNKHILNDVITQAVLTTSFYCSVFIAIVACPIWLIASRIGRGAIIDAIALGAALGAGVGFSMIYSEPAGPAIIILQSVLFGIVGITAGVVTWCIDHSKLWATRFQRVA